VITTSVVERVTRHAREAPHCASACFELAKQAAADISRGTCQKNGSLALLLEPDGDAAGVRHGPPPALVIDRLQTGTARPSRSLASPCHLNSTPPWTATLSERLICTPPPAPTLGTTEVSYMFTFDNTTPAAGTLNSLRIVSTHTNPPPAPTCAVPLRYRSTADSRSPCRTPCIRQIGRTAASLRRYRPAGGQSGIEAEHGDSLETVFGSKEPQSRWDNEIPRGMLVGRTSLS
jgi:hypothetical protein